MNGDTKEMNNNENTNDAARRPYPFEKSSSGSDSQRSYPFERRAAEAEDSRSYPFERRNERPGRRSYPFENAASEGSEAARSSAKGKGRRGGNSAFSIVRNSGRTGSSERRKDRDIRKHMGHGPKVQEGMRPLGEDISAPMKLKVLENTEIGTFLELRDEEKVLLPFAEQTDKPKVGEIITVCLFRDKGDRLTATMRRPKLSLGQTGILTVTDVTRIGAFLDNGMPKDILLPFREQTEGTKPGQQVLVHIYKDKSGRTAATMRVYKHLRADSRYKEGDHVRAFVYEISERLGVFVAVDNKYFGLIPSSEVYTSLKYGDVVSARVTKVREDGKLDLSLREKSYISINEDAEAILRELEKMGGELPYADKADPELIEEVYGMSKNQFKRALGHLYRERRVAIDRDEDKVRLL